MYAYIYINKIDLSQLVIQAGHKYKMYTCHVHRSYILIRLITDLV